MITEMKVHNQTLAQCHGSTCSLQENKTLKIPNGVYGHPAPIQSTISSTVPDFLTLDQVPENSLNLDA